MLGAIIASLVLLLVFSGFLSDNTRRTKSATPNEPVSPHRIHPLPFAKSIPKLNVISPALWSRVNQTILESPKGLASPSINMHQILLHLASAKSVQSQDCQKLLGPMIDQAQANQCFGSDAIVETRYGLRFRLQQFTRGQGWSAESHRDQCLAFFAMTGIPLNQPVIVGKKQYAVSAFLEDSIASFSLQQHELAWTAMAYASYLPPKNNWANRFGERYSFDQVVGNLMQRDIGTASCAGLHIFQALAHVAQVDRDVTPILGTQTRVQLNSHLAQHVELALQNQARDGSWDIFWHVAQTDSLPDFLAAEDQATNIGPIENRLIATSHMMEALSMLMPAFEIPDDVFRRAAIWCEKQATGATPELIEANFCPLVHMACFLRQSSDFDSQVQSETINHDSN